MAVVLFSLNAAMHRNSIAVYYNKKKCNRTNWTAVQTKQWFSLLIPLRPIPNWPIPNSLNMKFVYMVSISTVLVQKVSRIPVPVSGRV